MGLPIAAAQAVRPPLPPGWEEIVDANSGMPYWVHAATGETVFERPVVDANAPPPPPMPPAPPPNQQPAVAPVRIQGGGVSSRASLSSMTALGSVAASQLGAAVQKAVFGAAGASSTPTDVARARQLAPVAYVQVGSGWRVDVRATTNPKRVAFQLGPFATETEARAAAQHEAPPVWEDADQCARCGHGFGLLKRRTHCRNCGYSMCRACCKKTWPKTSMPAAYGRGEEGELGGKVCAGCDGAAQEMRRALLGGELAAVQRAYADGSTNVNLRCHVPPADWAAEGSPALLLPVHLAAAACSLPTLRWLAEEQYCPVVGPWALSMGKPAKSVLRVAVEAQAIDVLQWLVATEDAPAHVGLPIPMPPDTGCAAAAVHRALDAALKEISRQRALTQLTLEAAANAHATQPQSPSRQAPPAAVAPADDENECVVCLSAPRECVLLECGHACVCEQCSATLATCPMCRAHIERVVRMFQ
jgi:hypothetical protein